MAKNQNLIIPNYQKAMNSLDKEFEPAIREAKQKGNDGLVAVLYYEREAKKKAKCFQLEHLDDEDTKEKLTESALVQEYESIAPVISKAHVNLYLKSRLGEKYTSSKLRAIWELLKADMESYQVNNEPEILNTWDGVYNIEHKSVGIREPVEKEGVYDKFIPHFDVNAKAPTFQRVLNELNTESNPKLGEDLLKMYAYCTFGGNKLKTMFILLGDGDDGKSLIQNAVRNALGDYVATVAPKKIRYSRSKDDQFQTWLANMDGKKFAIVSEWGESDRLDNSVVKQVVSGGDSVAEIEQKNKNEQKRVQLTAPFIIDTNFLPDVTNVEPALIKRIAVLKFHRQYTESEKDLTLGRKLKAERAGILNMIIDAYDPNWQVPQEYRQAIQEEQDEQQADVDEILAFGLKQAGYQIDTSSTVKIERTKITQDVYLKQFLRDNHLRTKDLHDYFIRNGVKENRNEKRCYVGVVHKDSIADKFMPER